MLVVQREREKAGPGGAGDGTGDGTGDGHVTQCILRRGWAELGFEVGHGAVRPRAGERVAADLRVGLGSGGARKECAGPSTRGGAPLPPEEPSAACGSGPPGAVRGLGHGCWVLSCRQRARAP